MTLARAASPASAPSVAAGTTPIVARSIVSDPPGPTVQASPALTAAVPAPAFGPTANPVIQRIDGSPPPVAPPRVASRRSDDELDELAGALFGRFRNRLRNEYIHEREAKGLTFDPS